MAYTALPDMRMPYDNDGTVVGVGRLRTGIEVWLSGADLIAINDNLYSTYAQHFAVDRETPYWWFFWPGETRELTAIYFWPRSVGSIIEALQGSNDTTNGLDGTWETATLSGGSPAFVNNYSWRSGIKPVSFTGPKAVIRVGSGDTNNGWDLLYVCHLYGEKAAGQTPDDILFLDGQNAYAEYTAPEDFGDRPLGTTHTHTFKVKNASATLTANTINIQCNDTDFVISDDNATWVVTLNIASLAPGAATGVLYIRNTTPAVGNLLGPRFARIVATVGSWT